MKITKQIPKTKITHLETIKRCRALLDEDKPLPYKEEVECYIKIRNIGKGDYYKHFRNSLRQFGDYLEKHKVIYPTKGDAISFLFEHKDDADGFDLDLIFSAVHGFVDYCRANFHILFGGLFADTQIIRKINFVNSPLIIDDETIYEINKVEDE